MGISAKKEFIRGYNEETFFGASTYASGEWYLNGQHCENTLIGKNGERVQESVHITAYSGQKEIDIDMMFDGDTDDGTLKICRIPLKEYKRNELVITGINKGGNKDGFVPHLVLFGGQQARVYEIGGYHYGQELDI